MASRPQWPPESLKDTVWQKHEPALSALYDLMAEVGQALRNLPAGAMPRSVQRVVVLHLFVRTYKSSQAIFCLYANGFSQDAQSLLRGLSEGVIDLWYILRRPGVRARQFADFWVIGHRDWVRRIEKTFPEWPVPRRVRARIESDYNELVERRPHYKRLSKNWSAESIATRAQEADCIYLYYYYLQACQMLHSDPRSVRSYLRPGEGIDDGPSLPSEANKKVIEVTYACLLDAFNAANYALKWRKGNLVKDAKRRFKREFQTETERLTPRAIELMEEAAAEAAGDG